MKKKFLNPFTRNFLLSLAFHLFLLLFVLFGPKNFFKEEKKDIVQIDFVTPPPKEVEIKKIAPAKLEQMQVVDQNEKPLNDQKSDSKFLSAHNQTVQKQTAAQKHGEFKNSDGQNSKAGTGGEKFKPMTIEDFKPKFDIQKTIEKKLADEKILEKTNEDDVIKKFEKKTEAKAERQPENKTGDGGSQVSQTLDYIKNLDPGLETLLSTKEFVYYTYYARIRRQLNQYWGAKVREKLTHLYQQGRTIASSEDKVTKLLITLDKQGKLVKAQVIGDSGVHDLDEAAVEAFRAAAPFPNPPPGIVDPDGDIKIRWDFILEA